jgi:histidine kinase
VFGLYRYRLHRLKADLNMRFEERLAERIRLAQELHDTLLQGFLSVSLQVQVAANAVAADSKAKPILTRVMDLMRQVIEERAMRFAACAPSHNKRTHFGNCLPHVSQEGGPAWQLTFQNGPWIFRTGKTGRAENPLLEGKVGKQGQNPARARASRWSTRSALLCCR